MKPYRYRHWTIFYYWTFESECNWGNQVLETTAHGVIHIVERVTRLSTRAFATLTSFGKALWHL